MTYWRMQLHPSDPAIAVKHTAESLSAGYVGLGFGEDVGDLKEIKQDELPDGKKHYWAFAHEMNVGDRVLLFAHHYPFALVKVSGEYNYIRNISPEIGVWFRHFREVDDIRYYGDFVTNPKSWKRMIMTATITPLREKNTYSYRLIKSWLKK